MSTEKILKLIEEKKFKFVDLRFCDTLGKEQHVTLPISAVDEDLFEEGKMFDGSSNRSSSTALIGRVTCCSLPRVSQNRKSTN